ncbi:hypothetical protein BURMUCGD1_4271 [Burkholderia multivorans CGD1]|nr:hypothetical protein BURMUCGD1_4271 [Burkholderia multivorans CGD1]
MRRGGFVRQDSAHHTAAIQAGGRAPRPSRAGRASAAPVTGRRFP